ncbi:MAG TPA: phytanoyl-CoA dioxygenase family protein [Spirochaetia bacterium]|nr:phytanoyl-CoA dioxygenase family protein [Spirochaetia bacterium]
MTALKKLTAEETARYKTEGYLVYRHPVLTDARFRSLKDHFEKKLAALDPGKRGEHMDVPHFLDTALFEWLFDDEVLDLVEDILGPDIDLFSSHFISKSAGDGLRVPWHEDSAYWRDMLTPMEVVTVWLALDSSDEGNGCMYVIPRTHDNGFSQYYNVDPNKNLFMTEIRKGQFDEKKAVPIVLAENEASLHHAKLIHGSPANTSTRRRTGYTMRYIASSTRLTPENLARHQLYHARGKDYGINRYGDPQKTYPDLMKARTLKGH